MLLASGMALPSPDRKETTAASPPPKLLPQPTYRVLPSGGHKRKRSISDRERAQWDEDDDAADETFERRHLPLVHLERMGFSVSTSVHAPPRRNESRESIKSGGHPLREELAWGRKELSALYDGLNRFGYSSPVLDALPPLAGRAGEIAAASAWTLELALDEEALLADAASGQDGGDGSGGDGSGEDGSGSGRARCVWHFLQEGAPPPPGEPSRGPAPLTTTFTCSSAAAASGFEARVRRQAARFVAQLVNITRLRCAVESAGDAFEAPRLPPIKFGSSVRRQRSSGQRKGEMKVSREGAVGGEGAGGGEVAGGGKAAVGEEGRDDRAREGGAEAEGEGEGEGEAEAEGEAGAEAEAEGEGEAEGRGKAEAEAEADCGDGDGDGEGEGERVGEGEGEGGGEGEGEREGGREGGEFASEERVALSKADLSGEWGTGHDTELLLGVYTHGYGSLGEVIADCRSQRIRLLFSPERIAAATGAMGPGATGGGGTAVGGKSSQAKPSLAKASQVAPSRAKSCQAGSSQGVDGSDAVGGGALAGRMPPQMDAYLARSLNHRVQQLIGKLPVRIPRDKPQQDERPHGTLQQGTLQQDAPPQDMPPQDKPPRDATPQDEPPQDAMAARQPTPSSGSADACLGRREIESPMAGIGSPMPAVGMEVEVEVEDKRGAIRWRRAEVRTRLDSDRFVACVDFDEEFCEEYTMGDEGIEWQAVRQRSALERAEAYVRQLYPAGLVPGGPPECGGVPTEAVYTEAVYTEGGHTEAGPGSESGLRREGGPRRGVVSKEQGRTAAQQEREQEREEKRLRKVEARAEAREEKERAERAKKEVRAARQEEKDKAVVASVVRELVVKVERGVGRSDRAAGVVAKVLCELIGRVEKEERVKADKEEREMARQAAAATRQAEREAEREAERRAKEADRRSKEGEKEAREKVRREELVARWLREVVGKVEKLVGKVERGSAPSPKEKRREEKEKSGSPAKRKAFEDHEKLQPIVIRAETLTPHPSPLNPQPSTLNPQPSTSPSPSP